MNQTKQILKMAKATHGIITSSQITEAGIARQYLKVLADSNQLIKADRGIYVLPDTWEDELFILQYRYHKGIFSHETALYLHNFSERTPSRFTMTFPYGYHTSSLSGNVMVKKAVDELYGIGVVEISSPAGNPLRVYSIERTLCDIVRGKNAVDIQLIQSAMKKYAASKKRNIPLLMEYAEKLRVIPKIRMYMEILL